MTIRHHSLATNGEKQSSYKIGKVWEFQTLIVRAGFSIITAGSKNIRVPDLDYICLRSSMDFLIHGEYAGGTAPAQHSKWRDACCGV